MKFAYYPGCSADGSAVEYGMSMERTAKILGFEMQELQDWNCCGATSAHNTDKLLSLALPARNLAIAEKTGLNNMLAPCAACYSRHRIAEHVVKHDPEMKKKLEQVLDMELEGTSETVSILDVLANMIGTEAIKAKVTNPLTGMKAASYYGCLLVRPVEHTGFDDPEDPQSMDQVMQALGAETVDWSHKTECCGAAMVTSRPDVGNQMLYKVLKDAKDSGAECIVTACPLCMLNLDMRQAGVEKKFKEKIALPVYYVTELLAIACGDAPSMVGIEKHFVEAGRYLDTVKVRAAEAKAAAEKAAQEAAAKAKEKTAKSGDTAKSAPTPEAEQKKIDAFITAFGKNPDKMAARLIEDPARAETLTVVLDDKKIAKLAQLMASDMEKAKKAADAFVTAELNKRGNA
ncbi:Cysteine-rich domain [Syntrophomonas zehnderi OL-4]|uniref:Cysteine-rich domain n=1 Tax=Syntrophomonas zehnderi OL-4 TaxID=690567 RepID=A0A0E4G9P0_9FIRM|nr:CoB--CoM heterodisulfide reductase iron-sulfur subunit B family protein [Syntrophomonas zehnderi]CFX19238.1 Cysteine-rich domain [Syntrophomonas zehnderi OL-4]